MGYYKDLDIEMQEAEDITDEEAEFHFYKVLSDFEDLLTLYGYDAIVSMISPEGKFNLLEAIVKSQGRLMEG